jgi:hypothetical protein
MIEYQLRARGIAAPRVLAAMASVPREAFVPAELCDLAYADEALPIEHGQTISQPLMVGLMTELLAPEPDDRVLDVGTGSGYQAAVLAAMGCRSSAWSALAAPSTSAASAWPRQFGTGEVCIRRQRRAGELPTDHGCRAARIPRLPDRSDRRRGRRPSRWARAGKEPTASATGDRHAATPAFVPSSARAASADGLRGFRRELDRYTRGP